VTNGIAIVLNAKPIGSDVDLIRSSIDAYGMAFHSCFHILFNSSIDFASLGAIDSLIIDKSGEFASQPGIRPI
jgi:hypothetical protein